MCAENSARSFRNRPFSGVQEKRGCSRESCRFCVSQTGICLWKSGWGSGNGTGMDYLICAGVSETLQRNRRFPALTTAPVRQTGRASGQSVRDGRAETERQKRKILPAVFTGHFARGGGGRAVFRISVDGNGPEEIRTWTDAGDRPGIRECHAGRFRFRCGLLQKSDVRQGTLTDDLICISERVNVIS